MLRRRGGGGGRRRRGTRSKSPVSSASSTGPSAASSKERRRPLVLDTLTHTGEVTLHRGSRNHDDEDEEEDEHAGLLRAPSSARSDNEGQDSSAPIPARPPAGPVTLLRRGGGEERGPATSSEIGSAPSSAVSNVANGGSGKPPRSGDGGRVDFAAKEVIHSSSSSNSKNRKAAAGKKPAAAQRHGAGDDSGSDSSFLVSPPTLAGGRVSAADGRWGSMLWGRSYSGVHSLYRSVMGRDFSYVMETENCLFWSTLLSGFSVLPLFMLVFTAASNTAMGILFTAVGDVPHLLHWDDWARLALSTLGTMIALRNLLVSMYEMTMDNTAPYPLLNPTLLSRIRSIAAVRPRGLATLVTVLHIHSFCTLYGLTALGVKMGNVPAAWTGTCHVFLYNLLLKLGSWQLFLLYESRLKRAARKRLKQQQQQQQQQGGGGKEKGGDRADGTRTGWGIFGGAGNGGRRGVALGRQQIVLLRRLRKGIVWYYSSSDLALLLCMAAQYLVFGEGQELLRQQQMMGHDPHSYDELERRVVTFNCLALVITNFAALASWTFEVLTYGADVLERDRWSESIAFSRQASLSVTLALYMISLSRHGFLPAFFTLLVVFNGLSLSKAILWSCIEVHRTVLPLWDAVLRHPFRTLGLLCAYILATRTPSDAIILTLYVAAVFWAVRVQLRPHMCDIWAFGLTGLAVFMAVHQAYYSAAHHLELFNVSLTDTHLNISSLMGPMSLELLPPPGSPATGGGGLFRRLRASALSGRDDSGTANPVAESKRAHPKYPFCEMRPHGFSLMDYAAFSFLAYLQQDSPSFNAFFRAAFNSDEWAILRGPEPRAHGAVIIDAYNNRLNTSIVAIRGTNPKNLFDIFQDMVLFNAAFCWDVVGQLVPLVRWLPCQWTSNILWLAYQPLHLRFQSVAGHRDLALHYHPEIQEYVDAASRERNVVLTGHSLGGGLGKIVSAKLGIPIVAISAPGIYLSHKIFGVKRPENIDRYEINLMAPEDVVPWVDRLRGIVLHMQCHRKSPLECHNLGVSICDLYEKCGLTFQKGSVVGDRILGCTHP